MHFNRFLALAAAIAAPAAALAPLYEDLGPGVKSIRGKFIVKLKNAVNESTANEIKNLMDDVDFVYNVTSFKGFAGSIKKAALDSIREHPGDINDADMTGKVQYVESDGFSHANSYVSQRGAPWGLGRISHRGAGTFTEGTTYVYEGSAGEGVCAYVLDDGIRVDHEEFEGRAEFLVNYSESPDNDTSGHGTHVAGIIGGATYGVAKKVRLYSVKVVKSDQIMGSGGSTSRIMAGMEFVANDTQTRHCPNGSVVNMSVGNHLSRAINDLAKGLVLNAGVFVAVAAGNLNTTASSFSPGSEHSLCTVGATDDKNRLAGFSNHGSVVDILAPGVNILSAWHTSTTASSYDTGTSMAAPHIAGLAACLLASEHKDPKTLCDYMVRTGSPVITDPEDEEDTVNIVAFNGNPKG